MAAIPSRLVDNTNAPNAGTVHTLRLGKRSRPITTRKSRGRSTLETRRFASLSPNLTLAGSFSSFLVE
jgi:hypothetical protein